MREKARKGGGEKGVSSRRPPASPVASIVFFLFAAFSTVLVEIHARAKRRSDVPSTMVEKEKLRGKDFVVLKEERNEIERGEGLRKCELRSTDADAEKEKNSPSFFLALALPPRD